VLALALLLSACAGEHHELAASKRANHPGYARYSYSEFDDANNTKPNSYFVTPNLVGTTVAQSGVIILNEYHNVDLHFINGAGSADRVTSQLPQPGSRIQHTGTLQLYIVTSADASLCPDATGGSSATLCLISLSPK